MQAVQRTKHAYIHHKNNVQNAIRLLSLEHVQRCGCRKKKSHSYTADIYMLP